MRASAALAWRLLRAGGRRDMLTALLGVGAFAVTTTLLLLVLAGNVGFAARAGHKAWHEPVAAGTGATAIELVDTHMLRNHPVTVVELAPFDNTAPVPPGLDRFPAPGEMWVSPGLSTLLSGVPGNKFTDRFGARTAGVLGGPALGYPDELVAVVGHRPDDPRLTTPVVSDARGAQVAPVRIASFAGKTDSLEAQEYSFLTRIATVLLLVPLLILGAAAARLGVSRRLARLAAMRLVGATPRQVVTLTAVESMVAAAVGALAGVLLYFVTLPLAAQIDLAGGSWFAGDLVLPPLYLLGAVAGMVVLGGISAVGGLRGVVVSPLGVAQRQTPRKLRAIRLAAFAVAAGSFSVVAGDQNAGVGAIVTVLSLTFGSVALLGPWVIGLVGRLVVAVGRRPATLLAGRRLVDDPRAAWRTVGGLTLAGFVAGFVAMGPDVGTDVQPPADALTVTVQHGAGARAASTLQRALTSAGLSGKAEATPPATEDAPDEVTLTVPGDRGLDRTRTVVARTMPGAGVTAATDFDSRTSMFFDDLRTGTILVLGATFLIAMASAGITNAASVLDRRRTYGQLRLAGTPLSILDRARALETLLPLLLLGVGSIAMGVFCAASISQSSKGLTSSGVGGLGICVAVGLAGIVAASAASRPLLASVTREPTAQPA